MSSSDSEERDSDIENVAPVADRSISNGDKKAHDRKGNLGHEEKWRAAILKMSSKENLDITRGPSVKLIVQQSDLDDWIMNFIIVDVLPIQVVEKSGFQALVSSLAPHLKIRKAIHNEYHVRDKLRGATTDSGSNFLKCFRESGASSSLPNYDAIIDAEMEEYLQEEEDDEDMVYFEIGDVLSDLPLNAIPQRENVTLPVHRRCACHILSLICKVDILKIQDPLFEQLRSTLKDDASIIHCQPLITGLLDAIYLRFSKMFTDNELRLATISNPMFKLSWLENEEQYNRAKSEDSSDGTSSSRSDPSPEKRDIT
ncbi:hypothetical protein DAPPUDRAFT_263445 [Daphnia pulex]|uniref:Uncharacterized protein n=1 Tax=Daphnia pulex TaxID=6669 RepID=E9HPS6_DAPPU|nr:hypothetical protein DAPPUDRAFT_263445 [Daphnia pulex]|eukprot:EFX66260.1 hypothetical protein DAPPUDRAFT_263445 [Daphnia pulex]